MKKPWLAFLLNFVFPGVGLAYLGKWGRAVMNFFGFILAGYLAEIWLSVHTNAVPAFFRPAGADLLADFASWKSPVGMILRVLSGLFARGLADDMNFGPNSDLAKEHRASRDHYETLVANNKSMNDEERSELYKHIVLDGLEPVQQSAPFTTFVKRGSEPVQQPAPLAQRAPSAAVYAPDANSVVPAAVPPPPSATKRAFCGDCGAPAGDSKFCTHCGHPQTPNNICPRCDTQLSVGSTFCAECGAKAVRG